MKNKIIFITAIFILFGAIGYYIWNDLQTVKHRVFDKKEEVNNLAPAPAKTKELSLDEVGIEQNAKPDIPIPDLNRPINITENLDEAQRKMVTEKIKELSLKLKEDKDLYSEWLVLGIYRKMIGDYEGARIVWEYAGAIRPTSSTPFNNLGDLYAYYLKDNKKAEENFLKALENDPAYIYIYRSAYDFYLYVLKDEAKAKALLQKGIAANPGAASQGLQTLLKDLK